MMQPRLGQGSHHRKTVRWRQELSGIIPQRLYLEQEFHRTVSKQSIDPEMFGTNAPRTFEE
jgi:hypothetical protein